MIIVTGTKRSGTSMWMQVLIGAGLPHLGEAFPKVWEQSIKEANPHGFYESPLRTGIYYATNPDPRTGAYLRAQDTTDHVVKVFIPGVVRTERAYLRRVVGTMRHWRAYARSIHALTTREDAWLAENPPEGKTGEQAVADARAGRSRLPASVEWYLENFDLIRDFAVRRYATNLVTYERFVEEPEPVLTRVLEWLGVGDLEGALAAVDPELRRSEDLPAVASEAVIDEASARVFDALHGEIHTRSTIPRSLLPDLNATWERLVKEHGTPSRDRARVDELTRSD